MDFIRARSMPEARRSSSDPSPEFSGTRNTFAPKVFRLRAGSFSRWAHAAIFYGFATLFLLAGAVVALTAFGLPYPFPLLHRLKIIGNLAAMLLIFGSVYFLAQRHRASASRNDTSSWFDWALPLELLPVSVTGTLTEAFRYSDSAILAYPTYFVHLVLAFVLLVSVPYSKFAHVVYRTLALTARRYRELSSVARVPLWNRRVAV